MKPEDLQDPHREYLVGVISDTHGLLRPEAVEALRDAALIIHAGDIGTPHVLETLKTIAPVVAVRGNMDRGAWSYDLPLSEAFQVGGAWLYVLHDLGALDVDPAGFSAVISGHSHRPSIDMRQDVLFLNPGSVGPRRFTLPVTLALLRVWGRSLCPYIVTLDV